MLNRTSPLFGTHGNDLVVAIALIWAALIVAVSATLQGTGYADRLLPLLVAAAGGSVLLVSVGVKQIRGEASR